MREERTWIAVRVKIHDEELRGRGRKERREENGDESKDTQLYACRQDRRQQWQQQPRVDRQACRHRQQHRQQSHRQKRFHWPFSLSLSLFLSKRKGKVDQQQDCGSFEKDATLSAIPFFQDFAEQKEIYFPLFSDYDLSTRSDHRISLPLLAQSYPLLSWAVSACSASGSVVAAAAAAARAFLSSSDRRSSLRRRHCYSCCCTKVSVREGEDASLIHDE